MSLGLRKIASSVTKKLGTTFTYQTVTRTFDPVQSKTVETVSSIPRLKAGISSYEDRLVDGSSILATDLRAIVPVDKLPATPEPGKNRILIGTTLHTIVRSQPLYDGDEIAAYEIQLRTA